MTTLQRPDLRSTIRPRYVVGATLFAGVALGTGAWEYAKHHVHETMPRVVDCRADESTLDCQVAIDAAMFRTMHEVPSPADSHFVVTIVDCNGITWTLDSHAQQATISVNREGHCVEVRGYSMAVPGVTSWASSPGDTLMIDGPTYLTGASTNSIPHEPGDRMLTPAEVRQKLGIRLHP